MDLTITGLQALLSMISLELLKQLAYKIWPAFNLDPKWYALFLPALGLLVLPVASWLTGGSFTFAIWTQDEIRQTLLLIITTLGAMWGYNNTIKPFKTANREYNALPK